MTKNLNMSYKKCVTVNYCLYAKYVSTNKQVNKNNYNRDMIRDLEHTYKPVKYVLCQLCRMLFISMTS